MIDRDKTSLFNEIGARLIDFALIVSLIVVFSVCSLLIFGAKLSSEFTEIGNALF